MKSEYNPPVGRKQFGFACVRIPSFMLGCLALAMIFLPEGRAGGGPLASFSDADWVNVFGLPGANANVAAMVADTNGNVYVGGVFGVCGTAVAPGVAKWDGKTWSSLGSGVIYGPGIDGEVVAMALDHAGNLYIGGAFTMAGGVNATNVAEWNGTNWSALGTGISGVVFSLTLDGFGNLYAGEANNVAEWNGSQWSALGAGVGGIGIVAVDPSGNLYAGGDFSVAGVDATNVAEWDGNQWQPVGAGLVGDVFTLVFDTSGNLYAGGLFATQETNSQRNIAEWNGTEWSPVGPGLNGNVNAIVFDSSGQLYASGGFTIGTAGDVTASVGKWNGTAWEPIGAGITSGLDADVTHLVFDRSGNLYASGTFTETGNGVVADYISEWNGTHWVPVGSNLSAGINGSVRALAADKSGNVYAAGIFTGAGSVSVNNIAEWNGANWVALGSGLTGELEADQNNAYALAIDPSGNLYVGGNFVMAGGTAAKNIAEWKGTNWSALGTGIGGDVFSLACDRFGNLYAGGSFPTVSGVTVNSVGKLNGTNWSALGNGTGGTVNALVCDNSGNLYAGGSFTIAGGVDATNIAEWNGSEWLPLGSGINGAVYTLAIDASGTLYAGGSFTIAGQMGATNIAEWNGTNWSALGVGVGGIVYALAFDNFGNLYAGGEFQDAGTNAAKFIAGWNGVSWLPLGSGMGGYVDALARDSAGNLYAGGSFGTAGTNVSSGIAKALLAGPVASSFTIVKLSSATNVVSYLGTPGSMYALDLATNLVPPIHWTPQATNIAPASGYVTYTNEIGLPAAFYRTRLLP
jgi:trimeric autotransporter adhesin